MFTKVSVLIPTRQRIERLQTLMESYERTTEGCEEASELVFRIDEDDKETLLFISDQCGACRVVMGPRWGGYRSMPTFYNEMAAVAQGDVLMCGNDDMIFQTADWAPGILAAANVLADGLFDFGVTTMNASHFPFSIVSKRAVEKLGFIWDPRIFWGDIFLRDVMAWFGRDILLPAIRIDHDWAGNKPDQTFIETRASKATVEASAAYWVETHRPAVEEAVEKLRELLA